MVQPVYRFGDWIVEPELNRVRRDDEAAQLEPLAMDVLVCLLRSPGEVVATSELLAEVWPGRVVEANAVQQRISRIRRVLGDDSRAPTYIENIPRRGYRTKAAVSVEDAGIEEFGDSHNAAHLESVTPPFPAFEGDGDYVFVCYAHSDRASVYPELVRLRDAGVNVWYDEGISPGSEWTEELARAITGCAHFLYFVSPASVASRNCRDEVAFARDLDKPMVAVHVTATELPGALRLSIGAIQGILRYQLDDADYQRKLLRSVGNESAVDSPMAPRPPPHRRPYAWAGFATFILVSALWVAWAYVTTQTNLQLSDTTSARPHSASSGCDGASAPGAARLPGSRVAVLPFENLSAADEFDYFGSALGQQIWVALANDTQLKMVSFRAASLLAERRADATEIADQLGADYVVEGAFTRAGSSMRVQTSLVDVQCSNVIWSTEVTQNLDDVADEFALYDNLRDQISQRIHGTNDGQPRSAAPTQSRRALFLVRKASEWMDRHTGDPNRVMPWLDEAIELDPTYSRAYALKAHAHMQRASWRWGNSPARDFEIALAVAEKAVKLDPESASAHAVLGDLIGRVELDFPKAMVSMDRAYELFRSHDEIAFGKIELLIWAGRYEEALGYAKRWRDDYPIDWPPELYLGQIYMGLDQMRLAAHHFDAAVAYAPKNDFVMSVAIWAFNDHIKDPARTRVLLDAAKENGLDMPLREAGYQFQAGDPEPIKRALIAAEANRSTRWIQARDFAGWYFALGDYEEHMRWTRIRVEERDSLYYLLDEIRRVGDYWEQLEAWTEADPALRDSRAAQAAAHRALIETVTERMYL